MRLRPDELVAGVTARKARGLFRYCRDRIPIEGIADRLRLSKEDAAEVLNNLIEQGFVEPSDDDPVEEGRYELTNKARAVANAKFLKPISRARAEKLVKEAIARCREANQNGDFTHYVKRLHVFGSYNSDSPDLGDIDLVIELEPRPGIGSFVRASLERAKGLGRRPNNYIDALLSG